MCGVFGWYAKGDEGPELGLLGRIAAATEARGPHAFGFAWVDARGRLKMFKQSGRIRHHLGLLAMARDARILIGHCRYATHGCPSRNENNHPHPADSGWFVHNGRIPDYLRVLARYRVEPRTDCDSEVLGHLIERRSGPLLARCRRAVLELEPRPLVLLGLWSRPGRMVAARRGGQPLHAGGTAGGTYLASLPDALPGRVVAFPDDTAFAFGPRGTSHGQL
jgi:glucosamine 6-phosphate synthetase-like amidotransferase/phosphosugar isomerase protein